MASIEVFPGVLAVDALDNSENARVQSKFDIMREQQQLAEVNRAQFNLKALKTFRVQNEKLYRDKELQELRQKEIREPLEEALLTVEILEGKLQRRDEMIQKLRRYISVDLLKVHLNSPEENRNKAVELAKLEEHNEMVLMDSIAEIEKVVELQANDMERLSTTIKAQREKNKELAAMLETQEFTHKEHIRHIESDKDIYLGDFRRAEYLLFSRSQKTHCKFTHIITLTISI